MWHFRELLKKKLFYISLVRNCFNSTRKVHYYSINWYTELTLAILLGDFGSWRFIFVVLMQDCIWDIVKTSLQYIPGLTRCINTTKIKCQGNQSRPIILQEWALCDFTSILQEQSLCNLPQRLCGNDTVPCLERHRECDSVAMLR